MRQGSIARTTSVAEYPNWFKQIAQYNFEDYLLPMAGDPNLKFLQLGVFTGDASVWLLENVLTGQYSELTDVDTWQGADNEPIQEAMDFDDVYKTYFNKISKYKKRFNIRRCTTVEFLLAQYGPDRPLGEHFDFIYVDAHHTSASAFIDSELSWPLLKSGGILAIDDYEWLHPDGVEIHAPKLGIHMFLDRHAGEYEELARNSQLWIRKH
jgi:hypothetical protein